MTDSTKKIHFIVYDRGAISRLACLLLLNDSIQFITNAQPPDCFKYFRTVKPKKNGLFDLWENLLLDNLLTVLSDL